MIRVECTNHKCRVVVVDVSIYVPGRRCHVCASGVMIVTLSQTNQEKRRHREAHQSALELSEGDSLFHRLIVLILRALLAPPRQRNDGIDHVDL